MCLWNLKLEFKNSNDTLGQDTKEGSHSESLKQPPYFNLSDIRLYALTENCKCRQSTLSKQQI